LEQGEVYHRSHQLAMVMEKYDLDLGKFITRNVSVSDEVWRSIAKLVINLLFKMARLGIFHGDIKPGNIVLKVDAPSGKIEARLIDFDPKYMSTFSKDARLLEDNLDGNASQLCALYAVSMMSILHYHFQERRTRQPELLQRMDDALRLFSLYFPTKMDISDSKFGRVLVRHLRHYRLMMPAHPARPASGDRDRMLARFWEDLETMGVEVQEKPSDVPTFKGDPAFFVASPNRIEKMQDVVPALSEEMKKDVHSLVLEEEAKHKKDMEKRKAAKNQGF
jgi:serine/threonine protein kinase